MKDDKYFSLITNPETANYNEYTRLIPVGNIEPRYYINQWYKLDDKTGLLVMRRSRDNKVTHALFDLDDFESISDRSWYPHNEKSKPSSLVYVYSTNGFRLHRTITKCPTGMCVDHINRCPLDNRKQNMRICTIAENNKNMSLSRKNTSGVKGVTYDKSRNTWVAQRYLDGKYYTKRFKSFEDACEYRKYLETLK